MWPGWHLWQTHSLGSWPATDIGGENCVSATITETPSLPQPGQEMLANQITNFFSHAEEARLVGTALIVRQSVRHYPATQAHPHTNTGQVRNLLQNVNSVGKRHGFLLPTKSQTETSELSSSPKDLKNQISDMEFSFPTQLKYWSACLSRITAFPWPAFLVLH